MEYKVEGDYLFRILDDGEDINRAYEEFYKRKEE